MASLSETLLARPQRPRSPELPRAIADRHILVTGAGGSIGSHLCQLFADYQPASLTLFELSEFALWKSLADLQRRSPTLPVRAVLGSVEDEAAMRDALRGVEDVYHCAAYKHVPMVEDNPLAGILNNVHGTYQALRCAQDAETFVLVSTDKAVRPSSIMGATKRLAESLVEMVRPFHSAEMRIVRFGNVLASAGSVLEVWAAQIAAGEPLTVTDPRMTRYFMTIPEAAQLVALVRLLPDAGTFLLEMGEPIRILTLAERFLDLHELPRDRIRITQPRPGEKLAEQLHDGHCTPTAFDGVYRVFDACRPVDWSVLKQLFRTARDRRTEAALDLLKELVPDFNPCESYLADNPAISPAHR